MNPQPPPIPPPFALPRPARPEVSAVVYQCAVSSLVESFMILLMGGIAISIIGGILRDMTPSLPPGVQQPTHFAAKPIGHWFNSHEHQYFAVFTVVFLLKLRRQFLPQGGFANAFSSTDRISIARERVSREWFGLVVANAFKALVAAWIFVFLQRFSPTQILLHLLLAPIGMALHAMGEFVVGAPRMDALDGWFDWYGQNQMKFTFWFFYISAICDDLGLPNLKTLGRWTWKKLRNRFFPSQDQPAAGLPGNPA